jgi:hypothetical protein
LAWCLYANDLIKLRGVEIDRRRWLVWLCNRQRRLSLGKRIVKRNGMGILHFLFDVLPSAFHLSSLPGLLAITYFATARP